jgi:hypothetical protein
MIPVVYKDNIVMEDLVAFMSPMVAVGVCCVPCAGCGRLLLRAVALHYYCKVIIPNLSEPQLLITERAVIYLTAIHTFCVTVSNVSDVTSNVSIVARVSLMFPCLPLSPNVSSLLLKRH